MTYQQQVERDPLHYLHNQNTKTHEDLAPLAGAPATSDRQHLVPGDGAPAHQAIPVRTVAEARRDLAASQDLPEAKLPVFQSKADTAVKAALKEGISTALTWAAIALILWLASSGCTTAYKPKTFKTHCNVKMVSA